MLQKSPYGNRITDCFCTRSKPIIPRIDREIEDDVSARYVKLFIVGAAKTRWEHHSTINEAGCTRIETEYYKGLVPITDSERILWGNGDKEELPAGEHHFTFQFQVPMLCFPEFQSKSGSIRYYCKLFVDRPWEMDHTNEQTITVTPIYDIISAPPNLLQPQTTIICEKIGHPLFRRGEVAVTVTVPKTAFTPGEKIHATVAIANRTSKDVENVKMTLCECADFATFQNGAKFPPSVPFIETAGGNTEESRVDIASSEMKVNCPSRTNAVVEAFLEVPNVVPTFECAIIKLYYKLKVVVNTTSTVRSSVDCILPIVIFNSNSGYNIPASPALNNSSGSVVPSAPPLYSALGQMCEPPPPYTSCET